MPDSLAAIILAGGASRRMGRDKAGIRLDDGQTLLERTIAGVVRAGATEVVVAGDDPASGDAPADAADHAATASPASPMTPRAPGSPGSPGSSGSSGSSEPSEPSDVRVTYVREDPPLSGPVPALDAALERVRADVVLVLPCDLADPAAAAAHLVASAVGLASGPGDGTGDAPGGGPARGRDGRVAVDAEGHRQHLTAVFRTAALRAGSTVGSPHADGRVRSRVAGLDLTEVPEPADRPGLWADMDTPEDLARHRARTGSAPVAAAASDVPEPSGTSGMPGPSDIPGLEPWLRAAVRTLGLPESAVVTGPLLDMARDVARRVIRPGAPTTAYLIGLVVGQALAAGATPEEADRLVRRLSDRIRDLTLDYDPAEGDRP